MAGNLSGKGRVIFFIKAVIQVAGTDNLISIGERTIEEQREITSAGGRASGESRRRRKALKESMEMLLELPINNMTDYNELAQYGFDMDQADNSVLVVLGLFKAAKGGDVAAQKELRSLIGEGSNETTGVNQVIILGGDKVAE